MMEQSIIFQFLLTCKLDTRPENRCSQRARCCCVETRLTESRASQADSSHSPLPPLRWNSGVAL